MSSGLLLTLIVCGLWIGTNAKCSPRPAAFCETCPPGWTWYGGHCYLFEKTEKDWADAERYCNSLNGNLASIQSIDEYAFLRSLVLRTAGSNPTVWLGGHDAVKEGVWMWSDGSKFAFNSWAKGEPNNWDGVEDCMDIISFGGGDYVNDDNCNKKFPFLCVRDP